jgi:N-acetylglutamate synthase-like GNAT family acetyltransferase
MVWNQMLRAGVAIMWVCREEGRIIGSIGFIMSMGLMDGKITMEETFWFVDPDHRGMAGVRLFNEMKKHVQDSHIERVLMANMSGLNEARTEKFYERHGFVKLQTLYRLDL